VPKGLMSLQTFERVVDQAAPYARDVNLFLGGEPLINKQLPAMVAAARARGLRTRLHTNATLLDEERAEALLAAGLDFISFSFDGADAQTYHELRPGADFEGVVANIQRFGRLRGARKTATVVQLIERPEWTHAKRQEQRAGLHRLFGGPGIDQIKPIAMHNFGGYLPEQHFLEGRTFSPCSFLWYALNVGFDGTVVPCCLDFARQYPVGDLKTQDLMEVWNGPLLVALRERMVRGEAEEVPLCKGCDVPYKPTLLGVPVRDRASIGEFFRSALPKL
jgi:MoaA/NifB/PqqE/SkfB family radical SAM enzyme